MWKLLLESYWETRKFLHAWQLPGGSLKNGEINNHRLIIVLNSDNLEYQESKLSLLFANDGADKHGVLQKLGQKMSHVLF